RPPLRGGSFPLPVQRVRRTGKKGPCTKSATPSRSALRSRFAGFLLGAGEPVESAAQDVLTVPQLADAVALAGIDDHLCWDASRSQRLVKRLAHWQRTASIVAGVQHQGRRANAADVGER